ncbi:MAG: D-arabinono-1,4-lactone oxidase [Haloechinothrix sp.]
MTTSWNNWAGDQICRPAVVEQPANQAELSAAIARADKAGQVVRVAGAGHSFSDAVLTDGMLISLERMNRVLELDCRSGLVRVEAGSTLNKLSRVLWDNGLAFPNLGDIDVQSIAGAAATGTHGTGGKLMNISAALHSIELTLADGSTIEVNADNDPDAWRAARVSVGALGVVSAVTVRAVPAFTLEGVDKPIPMKAVLDGLDELIDGNDHFEFFAFPHSPIAMTRANNRTDAEPRPPAPRREWIEQIVLKNHVFSSVVALGRNLPNLIPRLNRLVARVGAHGHKIDRSYKVFASPRLAKFTEMEYAIPRERSVLAIQAARELVERQLFDVNFPLEVRWVAPDDAFLSPAGGRSTCYLAVHMAKGMAWEPLFREFEAIMDGFGGRPHWGKRHFQTAETLRPRYPDWDRFAAVRMRLDPQGRFANDYVNRVLGPVES